ncbi:MAG: DUF3667 domain-containing protein [Vicinamibacteraceae bacterium]
MSEPETILAPAPAPAPVATCANCCAVLHGPFCAMCGQADKPLDPPVRHFAKEFGQELLDVDGRVPRSLRRLYFSPGFLTREYLAGRRVRWLTPLRLYLIASVVMFAVLVMVHDRGGFELKLGGDTQAVTKEVRTFGFDSLAEMQAAIDAARYAWMPRVMFVLVPFFAWIVALLRRRAGRRFPAHFIFALEVHAAAFGMLALTKALAAVSPPMLASGLDTLGDVYIFGYVFLAFRTAYGGTRWRAALHTAIVMTGYTVATLTATAAIVAVTVYGRNWPAAFGR